MLTGKTALDLRGLALTGASLEIDGAPFTALDLRGIALALQATATLKVHNANHLTTLDLKGISLAAPGRVTFA